MLRMTAAAALVALTGLAPAAAQDLTTVRVLTPLPRHTAWFPLITGEALGYFEAEGVEVELVDGGDLPATAFLENGQVDLASLDPAEVILAHERGFDFDVVYEVMHGAVEGIFIPAGSPAQSLADLKGTTLGIVGESDRGLLLSALGHAGVTEDEVTIAVLGESAPLLANSLRTEQVSAIVGAISDFVAIRSQGIEVRDVLPPEMSLQPANNFSVRADQVDGEMAPHIKAFLRAWAKGAYAGLRDAEFTKAVAMDVDPTNWIDEKLGTLFLEGAQNLHRPEGETFGDTRDAVWEGVIAEMAAVGQIESTFPTSEILNRAYLDYANDFDRAQVEADVAAWKQANM